MKSSMLGSTVLLACQRFYYNVCSMAAKTFYRWNLMKGSKLESFCKTKDRIKFNRSDNSSIIVEGLIMKHSWPFILSFLKFFGFEFGAVETRRVTSTTFCWNVMELEPVSGCRRRMMLLNTKRVSFVQVFINLN